jgi:hypothetical protein
LSARGYLIGGRGEELDSDLEYLADTILNGSPVLGTFVGSSTMQVDRRFAISTYFERAGVWVRDITMPNGLHYLGRMDPTESEASAANLVEQAFLGHYHSQLDTSQASDPLWLCVIGGGASPTRSVMARADEIVIGTLDDDGGFAALRPVKLGQEAVAFALDRADNDAID